MKIQAISTGEVKITQNWLVGKGESGARLMNTLLDRRFTPWLPIYCFVIEHPEGLIVVDAGITAQANDPVFFPPWTPLIQRAAPFRITPEQELGPQMEARGLSPKDVRWVVLTHLHQDHEGCLHYFPQAEFIVARAEWQVAIGLAGRMAGYRNERWPKWFKPTLVDFAQTGAAPFPQRQVLTRADDVQLVPTPGHSAGHLSVVIEEANHLVFLAGDAAYTQELLLQDAIDGVGPDPAAQHATHRAIMQLAAQAPTVFLPSHEREGEKRLAMREAIPVATQVERSERKESVAATFAG